MNDGEHRERRPSLAFGPLQELVGDQRLTDIAVTCDGRVWVDCGAGMQERRTRVPFRSAEVVREYAVRLCGQLGRRLDDACPIADAASAEGIRVHAVIAPLVPQGAAISIRFPSRTLARIGALQAAGLCPASWLPLLRGLVRRQATVLISGGTGVGKTTLLRALLAECAEGERIVSVEEVRELGRLPCANHVSLVTREANVEGAGAVGLPALVKASLRMRPDRVVLGECRGEEIADLLRAFNSGHRGGMVTVHADDVAHVPTRLITLGLLGGLQPDALMMLVNGAFDAVLHLERARAVSGLRVSSSVVSADSHLLRNGEPHGAEPLPRRIAEIGRLTMRDGRLVGEAVTGWNGTGPSVPGPGWLQFSRQWQEPR